MEHWVERWVERSQSVVQPWEVVIWVAPDQPLHRTIRLQQVFEGYVVAKSQDRSGSGPSGRWLALIRAESAVDWNCQLQCVKRLALRAVASSKKRKSNSFYYHRVRLRGLHGGPCGWSHNGRSGYKHPARRDHKAH